MRTAYIVLTIAIIATFAFTHPAVAADAKGPQQLIDQAKPGGEVTVPKGTWTDPVRIDKPLKLRGEDRDACIIEVVSDTPAIRLAHASGEVVLENLTVRWKRATSNQVRDVQAAIAAKDGIVQLRNLRVIAPDGYARCPGAFVADGFADVKIDSATFEGFEFTIQFGGGAKGVITDSVVKEPGHCGITAGENSKVEVARTIVTGSRFHGVRCTGGELNVHDSIIIANKNRGVYLGNRPASGAIANNVIQENGSGISAFAESDVKVHNNLIAGNEFAGVDMRDTCRLNVDKNLLANNGRALALFSESGTDRNTLGSNASSGNKTEAQGFATVPPTLKKVDAQLGEGQFAIDSAKGFGLSDPKAIQPVWQRWTELRESAKKQAAAGEKP